MVDATKRALERLPVTAKRGLLSERAWADVRRAARLAHEEEVAIRLHGIVVTPKLKQPKVSKKAVREVRQKQAPSATAGEVPPSPGGKRKERSARRLQEFQEKKRAGFIAELVAKGCELQHAQQAVANAERMRLERIAQSRAQPMEADAAPAGHAQ